MQSSRTQHDPRVVEYCECFNRGEYFEAHEVLEGLWLETRGMYRDLYKGLIQTAAVFVKLQQHKQDPAARLANRALGILQRFPGDPLGLRIGEAVDLLERVLRGENPLLKQPPPQLHLVSP